MADVKVRLLRTKRWPHPNGQKRPAGTIITVPEGLADRWEHAGLVERTTKPTTTAAEPSPAAGDAGDTLKAAETQGKEARSPTGTPDEPPVRKRPTGGSRKRKK